MNIDILIANLDPTLDDCFLSATMSNIDMFKNENIKQLLKQSYNHDSSTVNRLASIFNAIFTHHSQTFMMSKRTCNNLLKNDVLNKIDSANTAGYKLLINQMIKSNYFICLKPSTNRKAAVFKLVNQEIVECLHSLHNKEWFERQERIVVEFHDSYPEATEDGASRKEQRQKELDKIIRENRGIK